MLAEDEAEDQAEPERVHRDPDQDERRHGQVEQRARPQRREEAERKRDPEPDDEPAEDERQRHGRGVAEAGRDGLTVRVGAAEVAVAHRVPDEEGVLVRERAVDAVGRREARPLLALREHVERHEDEQRDHGERESGRGQPGDEVPRHLSSLVRPVKAGHGPITAARAGSDQAMDPVGLEPTASAMPWRRSPS